VKRLRLVTTMCAVTALATPVTAAHASAMPARAMPASAIPAAGATIVVSAASSLTEAFTKLGRDFEHAHKNVKVTFNFGGSPLLVTQIENGAPVDVFASADEANMDKLRTSKLVAGRPRLFARNRGAIIVARGNPKHIKSVKDLAGVSLAVCAPAVPCGKVASAVILRSGSTVTPKSQEENVKAVVTRVSTGEVDAGIVYVTDAKSAGLGTVSIPPAQNATTNYPIAVVRGSKHAAAARAFIAYVRGKAGRATLQGFGFQLP